MGLIVTRMANFVSGGLAAELREITRDEWRRRTKSVFRAERYAEPSRREM
jgi:hypothetical protein